MKIKMTAVELVAYRGWINARIAEAKAQHERRIEDMMLPAELDGVPVLSAYIRGDAMELLYDVHESEVSKWWNAWFAAVDAQDDAVVTEALKLFGVQAKFNRHD